MSTIAAVPKIQRKKLQKRAPKDYSQILRHSVQLAFLALNAWIGVQFYLWVRYYETGGQSMLVSRPPGVEGWLPIASLMNLKVLLLTGQIPKLHPAGMFILIAFLAASWIFRKSFCSWLCPVGTVSEYLGQIGRRIFGRNFRIPRRVDIGLRSLKYVLLALFLYAVGSMSVDAIRTFLEGPYGIVDDVKMLNFFRFLGFTGAILMAILVFASVFVQNFWCRYLCPYGALMGFFSLASPLRIRRDPNICIDCGKCAKICSAALPVDRLITIKSAECTACMQCVAVCPAADALFLTAPRRWRVPAWMVAAGVTAIFLGVCGWAQWNGTWHTILPNRVYLELVPHANEFTHP